jgi:DNA-directed RNA polymerase specialized sigma24 family protein
MAESATPSRRRARRSTRISQPLAEARERNAAQLAGVRQQEKAVDNALAAFFDAGEQIASAKADCQHKIEPHERAIAQLRERLRETLAGWEKAQARAALTIHEAGRTVEQVGELLGLGEKAARRLIAAGREVTSAEVDDQGDDAGRGGAVPNQALAGTGVAEPLSWAAGDLAGSSSGTVSFV